MKILLCILLLPLAAFLLYVLVLFLYSLTVDQTKPIEKPSPFCRSAINFLLPVFLFLCGVKVKLQGLEKLPEEERFVFVCNHRSLFDPVTALYSLRAYEPAFLSKPSNLRIPLVGGIVYGVGCLPIDRENNRQALKDLLQGADYVKKGFCSMGIYPEGTRSKGTELLDFHAGSFKLAQRAGVGLAILATDGTEKVRKNVLRRRTQVSLAVLEYLPAEQVSAMHTDELARYSRERIAAYLRGEGE